MGAWGKLPWENDGAADWFDELFDRTRLAQQVESTLKLNVQDSHEEIRAAASVLLFLGQNYIWPVHDLDKHLALAANQLQAISDLSEIKESPEMQEELRSEIEELRSRIKTPGTPSQPKAAPKKWWQFGK